MRNLAGAYLLLGFSSGLAHGSEIPPFPADTVPVAHENDYLLNAPDADYWGLSEHYFPQTTNCSCSAASVTMALNTLRSRVLPEAMPLSEREVLAAIDDPAWIAQIAHDGGGVTMDDLEQVLRTGLARLDIDGAVETVAPDADALRAALSANESSPDSVLLAYYNQAVVTGDPDGGLHVSPIGAFNAEENRVLVMDVDRDCWLPYWTSTEVLLDALVTPDPKETGALADATGGLFFISAAI